MTQAGVKGSRNQGNMPEAGQQQTVEMSFTEEIAGRVAAVLQNSVSAICSEVGRKKQHTSHGEGLGRRHFSRVSHVFIPGRVQWRMMLRASLEDILEGNPTKVYQEPSQKWDCNSIYKVLSLAE